MFHGAFALIGGAGLGLLFGSFWGTPAAVVCAFLGLVLAIACLAMGGVFLVGRWAFMIAGGAFVGGGMGLVARYCSNSDSNNILVPTCILGGLVGIAIAASAPRGD